MNPAAIFLFLFDWRGVLGRSAYRRNLSILVLVDLLIARLDLLPGFASWAWTVVAATIGLSLSARRYHDMGRSAAWIVWANLVSAALVIAAFQFIPNVLDYIPLPEDWRVDAAGEAIFGRLVLPALIGVFLGNPVQSLWLAYAPSLTGANPYARQTPAGRRAAPAGERETLDEAALQAMIDRHVVQRQAEASRPAREASQLAFQEKPRQFGRRGQ